VKKTEGWVFVKLEIRRIQCLTFGEWVLLIKHDQGQVRKENVESEEVANWMMGSIKEGKDAGYIQLKRE